MASSQTKFYGMLGAIAIVGAGLIAYMAMRRNPATEMVTSGALAGSDGEMVSLEAGIALGSADAPVLIEEYASLQCPYCGMYAQLTFPQIVERYVETGKVRYVFFDFPFDELSVLGAEAARCAGEQNAYWPLHDVLFARMREWGGRRNPTGLFGEYAAGLGLDGSALEACVEDHRYRDAVMTTRRRGEQLGVDSTPTFIINEERRVTGALGFDQMAELIEEELAKQ